MPSISCGGKATVGERTVGAVAPVSPVAAAIAALPVPPATAHASLSKKKENNDEQ